MDLRFDEKSLPQETGGFLGEGCRRRCPPTRRAGISGPTVPPENLNTPLSEAERWEAAKYHADMGG